MLTSAYIDDVQIHETANYTLSNATGFGSPVPRDNRRNRAQRHGLIDLTQFYAGRVFALEGICKGEDTGDMWEKFDVLRGLFALGTPHEFRFRRQGLIEDDQVTSVTVASELEAPLRSVGKIMKWSVTLVSSDPRLYGAALKSGSYDPSVSLSGGGIPDVVGGMDFPLTFSTTTSTHLEVSNLGQFPTPPIFTINGPVVNPIVDNDTTVKSIFLVHNLGINDTIVVDVGERKITLNGASRPDLLLTTGSDWFELVPGTNKLRLRGSGMTTDETQLSVQFRDARI